MQRWVWVGCIAAGLCGCAYQTAAPPDAATVASAARQVTCADAVDCAAKWARATYWVRQHSTFPVLVQNEHMMTTQSPAMGDPNMYSGGLSDSPGWILTIGMAGGAFLGGPLADGQDARALANLARAAGVGPQMTATTISLNYQCGSSIDCGYNGTRLKADFTRTMLGSP